jgi:hypothetical protein
MTLKIWHSGDRIFWTYEGQDYCTNINGQGVWRVQSNGMLGNQVLGHNQLMLRGISRSTTRRRILRAMGYQEEPNNGTVALYGGLGCGDYLTNTKRREHTK